jgi:hypothetical protein
MGSKQTLSPRILQRLRLTWINLQMQTPNLFASMPMEEDAKKIIPSLWINVYRGCDLP